ncbi:MAG: hypothetical protein GKS01_19335 [Alphaproteobacteria bacterium]|nr:hypothetical protein [Alphaproteobacteria bacterium]
MNGAKASEIFRPIFHQYSDAQIVEDFLRVALVPKTSYLLMKQVLAKRRPDLLEDRWKQYPRDKVIKKWEIPKIEVGPDFSEVNEKTYTEWRSRANRIIRDTLKRIIEPISRASGKEIRILTRERFYQSKTGFIAFKQHGNPENIFKNNILSIIRFSKYAFHKYNGWDIFRQGTRFTPELVDQVEGQIKTAENHNIFLAKCNVVMSLEEPVLRALVNECLLRAMGLPGESKLSDRSVLSNWNRGNRLDRPLISEGCRSMPNKKELSAKCKRVLANLVASDSDVSAYAAPHPYDLLMLNLLYDERVKPGMSKKEVRRLILKKLDEIRNSIGNGG